MGFLTTGRSETTGLQFLRFEGSPDFGTRTISEDVQLSGNAPVEKDMLKNAMIMGVIEDAVSFNMYASEKKRFYQDKERWH